MATHGGFSDPGSELQDRVEFEALIADLSACFVNLPADKVDAEIEHWLGRLIEFLDLDRSTLFQAEGADSHLVATHCAVRHGFPPIYGDVGQRDLPWLTEKLLRGETIRFSSVDELMAGAPPELTERDRQTLARQRTRANVTVPLRAGGIVVGGLAFGSIASDRIWPDALVQRLRLVAHVFGETLARRRAQQQLDAAFAEIQTLRDRLREENAYLQHEVEALGGSDRMIGRSAALRHALAQAEQVARTDSTVLISGETGTGKELLAAAIHRMSTRRDRTMVKVNCAALPATLVEAELFGREKGAYTGALTKQIGRFELADASTIFLDEVSELPLDLQAKLLRVLQEGEFERLGSPHTVRVDLRVIAATNRDLERAVRENRFREDLYYRLNVFPIHVPSLRDRSEDIPLLVRAFFEELRPRLGKAIEGIADDSLAALERYAWPGNIRELRNLVERAMIVCTGPTLSIDLPGISASEKPVARSSSLEDVERQHIIRVLEETGWRVRGKRGAAEILEMRPTTLETRMAKLGIRRPPAPPQ